MVIIFLSSLLGTTLYSLNLNMRKLTILQEHTLNATNALFYQQLTIIYLDTHLLWSLIYIYLPTMISFEVVALYMFESQKGTNNSIAVVYDWKIQHMITFTHGTLSHLSRTVRDTWRFQTERILHKMLIGRKTRKKRNSTVSTALFECGS